MIGTVIECWGPYACFTRPEFKSERATYDCITPSAARGLVEAIYWHPGLRYVIDEIDLLAPIRYTNIKRNEVGHKLNGPAAFASALSGKSIAEIAGADRVQRSALILQDVHYAIRLHFNLTDKMSPSDSPDKFISILNRRAARGQCYHQPYFGSREFPACFRLIQNPDDITPCPETREMGYMLYDVDHHDAYNATHADHKSPTPLFFHARLIQGVMDLRDCEVVCRD